jgi:mRNA interferase MazF
MENCFDIWNEIKKKIDSESFRNKKFPKEGEVWMAAIGKNIGFEQNGSGDNFSRPILVIRKFNNQMFWCVPLSTKQKSIDFYFNYSDPEGNKVSAILAQMKLVSSKRVMRKIYRIEDSLFKLVKERLRSFL